MLDEREISLESGNGVHKSILELGFKSTLIDFKDIQNLEELKIIFLKQQEVLKKKF